MKSKLFLLLLILTATLALVMAGGCSGDDDDDDDTADDDDDLGVPDERFDPLAHLDRAFELAEDQLPTEDDPDVFAIVEIDGQTSPNDVPLDQKEIAWNYHFQVVYDQEDFSSGYLIIDVQLAPEESAEITCEGGFFECAYGGHCMLEQADFSVVTLYLDQMIALAMPELSYDVRGVAILKSMVPSGQFIGYYLIDENHNSPIVINAETGGIEE